MVIEVPDRLAALFSKVPVADPAYPYSTLLAAIAAVRSRRSRNSRIIIPSSRSLPDQMLQQANETLSRIRATMPSLEVPLALRVQIQRLPEESAAISASVPSDPQVIYLSDAAVSSQGELAEQLLHEYCHQWHYLLEEVHPFEHSPELHNLVLPSGTRRRSLREVLGALHVATVLAKYYATTGQFDQVVRLKEYGQGCLMVIEREHHRLSWAGVAQYEALRKEFSWPSA